MGAPALGDVAAWRAVTEKGIDKVVYNSINGMGGMPPKGGNEDLIPSEVKEIVDFMIDSSTEKH
jgi:cytochrome c